MQSRVSSLALCAAIAAAGLVLWLLLRSSPEASAPRIRAEIAVSAAAAVLPESDRMEHAIEIGPPASATETPSARSPAVAAEAGGDAPSEETGLSGTVVDVVGKPVAGAEVGLFRPRPLDGGGNALAAVKTDARGRFRFEEPSEGTAGLLLVAQKAGLRPVTRRLLLAPEELRRPLVLRLRPPAAVEGSLRVAGVPLANARLTLDAAYGVPGLFRAGPEMWWEADAAEVKHGSARTDEQGAFRVEGLSPIAYGVTSQLSGAIHPDVPSKLSLTASVRSDAVPSARSDVDIAAGVLEVTVFDGTVSLAADVAVVSATTGRRWTGHVSGRRTRIFVPVGVPLEVAALNPGFDPDIVQVPPLARSERRDLEMNLEPRPCPSLAITLLGAATESVTRLRVRLIPLEALVETRNDLLHEARTKLMAARERDGTFRIAAVPFPGGSYRMILAPDDGSSWMLPTEAPVFLPPVGLVAMTVEASCGGRFEVSLTNEASRPINGRYELRNSAGAVVRSRDIGASRQDPEMTLVVMRSFGASRPGREPSSLARPGPGLSIPDPTEEWRRASGLLEPGSYRLDATSAGRSPFSEDVVVEPAVETRKTVRLRLLDTSAASDAARPR